MMDIKKKGRSLPGHIVSIVDDDVVVRRKACELVRIRDVDRSRLISSLVSLPCLTSWLSLLTSWLIRESP